LAIVALAASALAQPFALAEDPLALRDIERRVQQVVASNSSATVAVTDGIGFGSGVIVSADGLVLTAGHVLTTGGSNFRVLLPDGRAVKARPLGKNLDIDAGMVQITQPGPWPFVELGDSTTVRRGQWCICLGHSGGYELGRQPPVRVGRVLDLEAQALVTDCALIGGDSGGPLFDLDGRLIAIHSNIGTSIAENRHVSLELFRRDWQRMQRGDSWGTLPDLDVQKRDRAALGVRVDRAADEAVINEIYEDSAAEAAGLAAGDVVTEFDGVAVSDGAGLVEMVKQRKAGDTVELVVRRVDEFLTFELTLKKMR
jgi:serine protease Do